MNRCKSCRHYRTYPDERNFRLCEPEVARFTGTCDRAVSDDGDPADHETLAFASDHESFRAELVVSEDFGCVQWEARDSVATLQARQSEQYFARQERERRDRD